MTKITKVLLYGRQAASRVALNTGILYARMAITVFISLYSTRLILEALGAEDFGIFSVVGGTIAMLTFLNTAMAAATQRFMSYTQGKGDYERLKKIFNVSVVLHIGIAIIILLLLEGAGYLLFNGILKISEARIEIAKLIYQFMVISMLFTIVSVPYDAVINAHENMFFYAILGIVEAVAKLAIALYILHATFDKLAIYGLLISALSAFLFLIRRLYCHHYYNECRINIRKYFNKPLFKEMTGFAGWSFLGSSSSIVAHYGQGLVVNMFFGTVVNAAQGIAAQVSGQLAAFSVTMLKALNPVIDKSEGSGNRELMLKASMMGSKVSFFLMMFFYIPVLIEMPYIFKIWLSNVPEYAVIFCRLLLIRNLIEQLFVTLSSSISAVGNIRKYQIYNSILNLFPLIVSYLLFNKGYPAYSIYIVYIIYSILASTIVLYFSKKNCNLSVPLYFKNVITRCIISFALVIAVSAIPVYMLVDGYFRLLTVILISTTFFSITVWFVGCTTEEKIFWGNLIQTIRIKMSPNKI
jgi:O-antigen/teichoic acid export membrane protein